MASARALGQHDAELLLSYLTVPYLRIPLVISFFATDDRAPPDHKSGLPPPLAPRLLFG